MSSMYELVAHLILASFSYSVLRTAAIVFGAQLTPNPNLIKQYVFPLN